MKSRKTLKIIGIVLSFPFDLLLCFGAFMIVISPEPRLITFPDGKSFGFTVFDDTDSATVEKIKPVYDYLYSLGIKTGSIPEYDEIDVEIIKNNIRTVGMTRDEYFTLLKRS